MKKLLSLKIFLMIISLQLPSKLMPLTLTEYIKLKKDLDSNPRNLNAIQQTIFNIAGDLARLKQKEVKELSEEEVKLINYIINNFDLEELRNRELSISSENKIVRFSKDMAMKAVSMVRDNPKKVLAMSVGALIALAIIYKDELLKTYKYISDSNIPNPSDLQETLKTGERIVDSVIDTASHYTLRVADGSSMFRRLRPQAPAQEQLIISRATT